MVTTAPNLLPDRGVFTARECSTPDIRKALGEVTSLGLQPLADDTGALLAVGRPRFRETVVSYVVALDAERVLNNLGGAVAVIAVDSLFKQVGHSLRVTVLFGLRLNRSPTVGRYNFHNAGLW